MIADVKELQGNTSKEELILVAELMFRESRFARLGLSKDKLWFHCDNILTSEQYVGFGAFDNGVLCGFAIGVCGEVLPFTEAIVATEHYLYLLPEYRNGDTARKLVKAFTDECYRRGAKDVVLSNGYGGDPDKAGKLFEACGANRIGGIYTFGG